MTRKIVHEGQKANQRQSKSRDAPGCGGSWYRYLCKDVDEAFIDVGTLRKTISGIADELGLWVGASRVHIPSAIGKAS